MKFESWGLIRGKGYALLFIFAVEREHARDFVQSQSLGVARDPSHLDFPYDLAFSHVRLGYYGLSMIVYYV